MGTKRSLSDFGSQEADDAASDNSPNRISKRRKQLGQAKHKAKEGTSEFAKKRVRSIERLLQRKKDLPADVRNELERELAAHRAEITDKAFHKKRSAMITKYHMVRFFERKKASRLVKQLRRQVEQNPDPEDVERLKRDLHVAEVDEAYTLYHPHVEPYVSLFSSAQSAGSEGSDSKEPAARTALKSKRPPMWSIVEMTMAEGPEALKRLRERRPVDGNGDDGDSKRQPSTTPNKTGGMEKRQQQQRQGKKKEKQQALPLREQVTKSQNGKEQAPGGTLNRRQRRQLMREAMPAADDSDGDGGGFFEGV
ncbi:hypothetical protein CDD83_8175 [Cordyceps sp. RAO-2017]|nr:hypothetical protein CDD83_8175 [Cordyceps sp. RAO-2017]